MKHSGSTKADEEQDAEDCDPIMSDIEAEKERHTPYVTYYHQVILVKFLFWFLKIVF